MQDRRISVVIAAYNAEATLGAALASILSQSLPPDDVVVVDDGSTDQTVAVANDWASRLPLRVIALEVNSGVGITRTTGFDAARHDIIATLDSDDIWLPDHLESLVPLMTDESVIVEALPVRWAPGLGIDTSGVGLSPRAPAADQQVEQVLLDNFLFIGSLFSKRALDRVGGGSLRRTGEDWHCWIRLIVQGGCRVVSGTHPTVVYRASHGSVSAGEGCLPYEFELLGALLVDPLYADHRATVEVALKRRRARTTFLAATAASQDGRTRESRGLYRQALAEDPSFRGGVGPGSQGSVALRSMVGLASPRLARSLRNRRLASKRIVQVELDEDRFRTTTTTTTTSTSCADPLSPKASA